MTFSYVDVRGERVEVPWVLFSPVFMPPPGYLLCYRLASGVVVGFDVAAGEYREIPTAPAPAPAPARKRKRSRYVPGDASAAMVRDMFKALLRFHDYSKTLAQIREETGVPKSSFYEVLGECDEIRELKETYLARRDARLNRHQRGRRVAKAAAPDDE